MWDLFYIRLLKNVDFKVWLRSELLRTGDPTVFALKKKLPI